ncbi:MAG TPA: TonB-dependent receptor [Pyrinomonadaceae bacterium]|nr:TonB-dependent receptor [Pyrinomonadaceae bacterium]
MIRRHSRPSILYYIFSIVLLLVAHCPNAIVYAQTATATLSGTVEDQNGAVVPSVGITIQNIGTSLEREVTTNDSGYFTAPLLPPGSYTVTARRDGFTPVEVRKVVLNVGDQKALQIQLKAGSITEMVQVIGEAPLINESPSVGTVVDRQFVGNIPLNGRSFQSLVTLTPGVVIVPVSPTNRGQFSVNGQRTGSNAFMVDGVSANVGSVPGVFGQQNTTGNLPSLTTFGTTQSLVSLDALQEFKVQTSGYAAEYGRQPGGQISIVTRSGTNEFHGSLFDYIRNDIFDANDWFANANRQRKPAMRQNDFGGTFSGPVVLPVYNGRNRTFFFLSYEGLRLRLPKFSLSNVPTLALRQQAPTSLQPILNAFPIPNGKDLGNGLAEFSSSYSDPSSLNATSIRFDHTINGKNTLFGRYNRATSETSTRIAESALSNVKLDKLNFQTVTFGITTLIRPAAINDLRFNYSSNLGRTVGTLDNFGGSNSPPRNMLIPSQHDSSGAQGVFLLRFVGATSVGFPQLDIFDQRSDQRQLNIIDNFSYAHGSHQLKFGFDYRRLTPSFSANPYLLGVRFTTSAGVLAATANRISIFAQLQPKPIIVNLSAYAQDTWRVSRRLTLDLGLRWDVNPAPSEANGLEQLAVTQVGDLGTMDLAPLGTKAWKTTYTNFAPRVGVAYQLSQKPGGETVLRGGFGVFYDTGNDFGTLNFNGQFPFTSNRQMSNVSFPLSATQLAPGPIPIHGSLTPPYGFFFVFDPELKLPYTLQWNLAVERSLGSNQVLSVSYVGAAGRRLLQGTQVDLSQINPKFSFPMLVRNKATSDYHALQTKLQRRLSKRLQALASYSWSHALDDDSTGFTFSVPRRGNADFDVRHVFAAGITYDIPDASITQVVDALLGGWSVDTVINVRSALPVDLKAGALINPVDGSFIDVRPNVLPGVPLYLDDPSVPGGRRINQAAFSLPPTGQSGNLGRNQVRGLNSWQVDLGVRRELVLTEKVKLQIRAEAFNIFNHPNFGGIQQTLTAPNFGQATSMLNRQLGGLSELYQIGGPRSMQFALKLSF